MHRSIKNHLVFVRESIRQFKNIGAIAPSSPYLAGRMTAPIKSRSGLVIVELGAGTGSFTKTALLTLPQNGRLLAFESNPILADKLAQNIHDKRLSIVCADAVNLHKELLQRGITKADYIISGLPLGNMSRQVRARILSEIELCLAPEGRYVQFQYFLANALEIRKRFHVLSTQLEPINIPPAFVYVCKTRTKTDTALE
jgi:phospholipid N-methyltransferase